MRKARLTKEQLQIGRFLSKNEHKDKIEASVISPNKKFLVTAHQDYSLYHWDLEAKVTTRVRCNLKNPTRALAISQDNKLIASGGFHDAIRIYSAKSKKRILSIPEAKYYIDIKDLAFSPDSQYLAAVGGDLDFYLLIWEVETGKQVFFKYIDGEIYKVDFSENGDKVFLINVYDESIISIWNIKTAEQLKGFGTREYLYSSFALSNSKRLIAGSEYKQIFFWDTTTGKEFIEQRINAYVRGLICFSADDTKIAAVTKDHTRIWNIATGKEIYSIFHLDAYPSSLSFIDNDSKLVIVLDREIRIIDLSTEKQMVIHNLAKGHWLSRDKDGKLIASSNKVINRIKNLPRKLFQMTYLK